MRNFAPRDDIPVDRVAVPRRFAYIGRLDPLKGILCLIEAIGRTEGALLDVAGEGPAETELGTLADRVAPGRVTFHGRVDPRTLARIRDASIAVVVPSLNENSPLAVLEALQRGCPVVGSDCGGIPELVKEGESGLLFPPGDVDDSRAYWPDSSPIRSWLEGWATERGERRRPSASTHT